MVVKVKGLLSSIGWKERAEAGKGEERWKRAVESEEGGEKIKKIEKIPLQENYELGTDRRGLDLNSTVRRNSNFGTNKKAVLPRMKAEARRGTGRLISPGEGVWGAGMLTGTAATVAALW